MKLVKVSDEVFGILLDDNTVIVLPNNSKNEPHTSSSYVHRSWNFPKCNLIFKSKSNKITKDSSFVISNMGSIIIHYKNSNNVIIISKSESGSKCKYYSWEYFLKAYNKNIKNFQHIVKISQNEKNEDF